MKRRLFTLVLLIGITIEACAVLKEKNLDETLSILRTELTKYYHELSSQREVRQEQTQEVFRNLTQTMKLSNQNALMLYSQKQEYLFDLTYACHDLLYSFRHILTTSGCASSLSPCSHKVQRIFEFLFFALAS